MNLEEKKKIISNDYAEVIVQHFGDRSVLQRFEGETENILNRNVSIVYWPRKKMVVNLKGEIGYAVIPKIFTLSETSALDVMGVSKIQNLPHLGLKGSGVLLGFVDTGIDYTNPLFKNADNTSRIISIWDQTVENLEATEEIFHFGKEYNQELINEALKNENPLSVVPTTDDNGHGTMLAGLAGGSRVEEKEFEGVITLADFVVVKLKPAKQIVKDFFLVPEGALCFQENDIMFGVNYLVRIAKRLKRPIAICIALGTNMTAHDGKGALSTDLSYLAEQIGVAIVVAGGNEGNEGHHYFSFIDSKKGFDLLELKVTEGENNFPMQIWGSEPGTYSIDILSPGGEYIPRIPARLGEFRDIQFLFEETKILVDYILVEAQTGVQLIFVRFFNVTPGIWRFKVYGRGNIGLNYHAWLPAQDLIKKGTVFLKPNSEVTIMAPGNCQQVITVTAYNHNNDSIYLEAGKGYSRTNIIKPELAAPGVEVYSPMAQGQYGSQSGTSIAAAFTTGIAGMLLEWGIQRGQYTMLKTSVIKKFLIRGARRSPGKTYPNKEWGYGIVDIYNTFDKLRGDGED